MSLLPIDPADFPDVPTRKALIAIDLQNDFLSEDGALPVEQPDGMVDRIVRLAEAVRNSGYGEVIWVRSQFDTNRAASEQQIMAADSLQLPTRPGASAAAAAARMRRCPAAMDPLEADPEAFLSIVGGQAGKTKPLCVRKGTSGADLLPAIAAAKGPRDYAMTKSYYSAFQSGQLLNLLRRQFATELIICGSLSNVSVYATTLAASSHGFDITIVEDCCGYRSETRHMNAARKLMEQTGCEFRNAADVIPTLRPKSPSQTSSGGRKGPGPTSQTSQIPRQIPTELLAAAMAGGRNKGIPVRPKPPSPPPNPERSPEERERAEEGTRAQDKALASSPSPSPPPPSSLTLLESLDKLKLSSESAEHPGVPEPADEEASARDTALDAKKDPAQPEAKQTIQPMVKTEDVMAERAGAKAEQVTARVITKKAKDTAETFEASAAPEVPEPHSKGQRTQDTRSAVASSRSGTGPSETDESVSAERMSGKTRPLGPNLAKFIVSDELLTTPAPEHFQKEVHSGSSAGTKESSTSTKKLPVDSKDQHFQPSNKNVLEEDEEGPVAGEESNSDTTIMAGDCSIKPTGSAPLCEGDTSIIENFLPPAFVDGLFERLCEEVHFRRMMHQGGEVPRFVAVQGSVDEDGTQPIYRHPSDESPALEPFTPTVQKIRELTESALGHPLNHVLIQCYRNGNDYISEHSDKTLDIFRWSYIANLSIGAQRTMTFRTKRGEKKDTSTTADRQSLTDDTDTASIHHETSDDKTQAAEGAVPTVPAAEAPTPPKRQTIRCPMPHNSLVKMGLVTNEKWLHGIKPDKRLRHEKLPAELAWGETRISLTFRNIATFLSYPPGKTPSTTPSTPSTTTTITDEAHVPLEPLIWGQGATSKTRDGAQPVRNGQTPEAVALIKAFGRENNSPDFDWEANYGRGYDVLHLKAAPRYFGCGDTVVDGRVRIMLAECGVKHTRGDIGGSSSSDISSSDTSSSSSHRKTTLVRGAAVGEVVPVRFVDGAGAGAGGTTSTGNSTTTVVGDMAILLYLDARHPRRRAGGDAEAARVYSHFYAALALEQRWKRCWEDAVYERPLNKRRVVIKQFKTHLAEFEAAAAAAVGSSLSSSPSSSSYTISEGAETSIADYALWPVLHDIATAWKSVADGSAGGVTVYASMGLAALDRYYTDFAKRQSVVQVFGADVVKSTMPYKPEPRRDSLEGDEEEDEAEENHDGQGQEEQEAGQQHVLLHSDLPFTSERRQEELEDKEKEKEKEATYHVVVTEDEKTPSPSPSRGKMPQFAEFGGGDLC